MAISLKSSSTKDRKGVEGYLKDSNDFQHADTFFTDLGRGEGYMPGGGEADDLVARKEANHSKQTTKSAFRNPGQGKRHGDKAQRCEFKSAIPD